MTVTDGELLERWRNKDLASGELLFERYYSMMERFFINKVPDAPPDLVQETFVRCVANREKVSSNEHFREYIFGIAYNVLKEHLRRRYRGGQQLDLSAVSLRDMDRGPITLIVEQREHQLLLEALRRLPVEDQTMLELHYWEELTTDAIAGVLGIPPGTARGRLQRAREKLAELMHRLTDSPHDLKTAEAQLEGWARGCRAHLDTVRASK
jgi:RNA polymerase sigma-70 factor, ECF subfamily